MTQATLYIIFKEQLLTSEDSACPRDKSWLYSNSEDKCRLLDFLPVLDKPGGVVNRCRRLYSGLVNQCPATSTSEILDLRRLRKCSKNATAMFSWDFFSLREFLNSE